MSSRTLRTFLELEQWNRVGPSDAGGAAAGRPLLRSAETAAPEAEEGHVGQLAAAAAADYWSLQELRQELEVVRRSAEAAGVPLAVLLRLADGGMAAAWEGAA